MSTDSDTWLRLRRGEFSGVEAFQRRLLARARQPRPCDRLRGDVPAGGRPPAAARDPRHPGRPPPHLDAHHGPRARRAAAARAGRNAGLAVRDRRRAQPLLPRARARPPGLRLLRQANARRPTTRAGSPRSCSACSTNSRSTAPTWSATRWAVVSRSSSAWWRPSGFARSGCCVPPWPGSSAAFTRSCASCDPSSACSPTPSAAPTVASQFWSMFHDRDLIDPAVADLVVDEFQRIYHTAGARYALLASARNIYLEAPFGRGGFYRRLADLRPARPVRVGQPRPARARRLLAPRAQVAAARRAGDDRRVRARAAGGASGGDQRAAARLLPARRAAATESPIGRRTSAAGAEAA